MLLRTAKALLFCALTGCGPSHESEIMPLDGAWIGRDIAEVDYPGVERSGKCDHDDPRQRTEMASVRYQMSPSAYGTDGPLHVVQSIRAMCGGSIESVHTTWTAVSDAEGAGLEAARAVYPVVRDRVGPYRERQSDLALSYGVSASESNVPVAEYTDGASGAPCAVEYSSFGSVKWRCGE